MIYIVTCSAVCMARQKGSRMTPVVMASGPLAAHELSALPALWCFILGLFWKDLMLGKVEGKRRRGVAEDETVR